MPTSERDQKHILSDTTHSDGSQTIEFRSDTSFTTKKRIAKSYEKKGKSVTLYSDGRLEVRPEGNF